MGVFRGPFSHTLDALVEGAGMQVLFATGRVSRGTRAKRPDLSAVSIAAL